jgi:hypothetical protein
VAILPDPALPPTPDVPQHVVFHGSRSRCVRLPGDGSRTARYAVVTHKGRRQVAMLRWHRGLDRLVLVPGPETSFDSAALSEIALWLRRLTRLALEERLRTTGTL